MADFEALAGAIIECNAAKAGELTQKLVDEGVKPSEIINMGLIGGMNIVKPLLLEGESFSTGKVIVGTVAGDLHDIGKNLVGMMMESGGMEVVDLGVDVTPEKFAAAVREHKPQVVGLSALLTTTMLAMKDTIEVLKEEGLRDSVKVIVGGAPVTQDFADEIGADGWAPDAASAKDLAQKLAD